MVYFLTADDGRPEDYAALTRESKRVYCEAHGYAFQRYRIAEGNPYWGQVAGMLELFATMEPGDWMNYTGADSYIVPGAEPCESLLDENFDLIISKDENGLNNNGFFLRKGEWGDEFLHKVWAQKSDNLIRVQDNGDGLVYGAHGWFEQAAFIVALREIGLERVRFVPQLSINAYPWKPDFDRAFIAHLPGRSHEDRVRIIRRALLGEPEVKPGRKEELESRKQARGFFGLTAEEHSELAGLRNV